MISMVFWNVYGLQPVTSMVMDPEAISSVPEKMRERRSASVRGRLQDALPQGSGAWKVLWRFLIAMLRHRATSSFERGASCFRHDLRMMEEETSRSLFLCNGGSCLHVAFDSDSVLLLWKSRHVMSRCSRSCSSICTASESIDRNHFRFQAAYSNGHAHHTFKHEHDCTGSSGCVQLSLSELVWKKRTKVVAKSCRQVLGSVCRMSFFLGYESVI